MPIRAILKVSLKGERFSLCSYSTQFFLIESTLNKSESVEESLEAN